MGKKYLLSLFWKGMENIMKCDYCGYENAPDVKCCAFCGVELVKEEPVWQEEDSGYAEYKREREKQKRREHWEKRFQAEQKQMPSSSQMPVWKEEEEKSGKENYSLGMRLKRMPAWIKIALIILLFSQPIMALFWFIIWLLYDQSRRK